jgi:hypothetical protein
MGPGQKRTRHFRAWLLLSAVLVLLGSSRIRLNPRLLCLGLIPPVSRASLNRRRVPIGFSPAPYNPVIYSGALLARDGRVYVGASRGKKPAKLLVYDPAENEWDVIATMTSGALRGGPDGNKLDPGMKPILLNEESEGLFPGNTWKHVQNKIHSRLYEGPDGRIYGATHTSVGNERPNNTRTYGGGHFFVYDPETEDVRDLGWARRHEGIMSICMDVERMIMYGVTWPCGLLVKCHADWEENYVKGRGVRTRILGLTTADLESVPRYMEVLRDGRVFVADGATGDVLVWVPRNYRGKIRPAGSARRGRINRPDGMVTPYHTDTFAPGRMRDSNSYRNWWQTGALSPDGMRFYVATQRRGQLFEIDGSKSTCGRIIDHPWAKPWARHTGGWGSGRVFVIAFGRDGRLYYLADSHLLSYDPATREISDWGILVRRDRPDIEISHSRGPGSVAEDGTIYFGATFKETGKPGKDGKKKPAFRAGLAWFNPSRMEGPKLLYRELW